MPATSRKNNPKLRDGVMKRGTTWSYVIRVRGPRDGDQQAAMGRRLRHRGGRQGRPGRGPGEGSARRVHRPEPDHRGGVPGRVDRRSRMEIKPRTLADYRACIRLYATPRIGHLPIQAVRPSTITKLYRDLLTSGGRDGQPLAVATVTHLHAVLRKAFRDAVIVDELIGSNPVERAKRPRAQAQEPGTVWTIAQLRAFLATAQQHRLFAFFHVAAYTGARRGELLNLRWKDIDLDGKKITITGSTAVIAGERVNGTTKSGRTRVVSIDDETVAVLRQRKADQAAEQLKAGDSWRGTQGRVRVHDRMGRAHLPRYRHLAHDQAHPRRQAATACAPTRSEASARHNLFALRRPRSCGRGSPGPRRPGYHPPRLRPCDPLRRGRRRRHLRRCGQGGLVSKPVSKKAPSKIGKGL